MTSVLDSFYVGEGWDGGSTEYYVLLALAIVPLTTHPFLDRTPFPLLLETPPTTYIPGTFFYMRVLYVKNIFAYHVPFLFRLLWPPSTAYHRVATIFSLLSSAPNSPRRRGSTCSSQVSTHRTGYRSPQIMI